jgi:hypothetical protein
MATDESTVIIIRNLTARDRITLKKLRDAFGVKSNSQAVMKAAEAFDVQKNNIDARQYNLDKKELERVTTELSILKNSVRKYFAFIQSSKKGQNELTDSLIKLSSKPL